MSDVATKTKLAKVAHLVDSRVAPSAVVINRGSSDGVKLGDKYLIFGYGPEIVDPDSGEDLGRVELVRGRGEVMHVQDHLATVRSIEYRRSRTKRRVVRSDLHNDLLNAYDSIIRGGRIIEEELPPDESVPFEGVSVGDLAKPI